MINKNKFKKGRLYLYNPVYAGNIKSKYYVDIPVLSLHKSKNYAEWLCFFPDGRIDECHPEHLTDISLKKGYQ